MDSNYLEFIRKFLSESPAMVPEPTGIQPSYTTDPAIKAIIFDIYGTIVISASGDIEESDISVRNLEKALYASGIEILAEGTNKQEMLLNMLQDFRQEIISFHENERSLDKPYPEIDILAIWENILNRQDHNRNIEIPDILCMKCFTIAFETLSNNIFPMPGMKQVIDKLSQKGIPLGIISNAQFYTPVILNYFLNDVISEDEHVRPFDPDITVYSYKLGRAKPDAVLFDTVAKRCIEKYGISPSEILFIGNDMFRDIYPAHNAGYKTVLFAGDNRSLRLREEIAELKRVTPDHTITDLSQILKIIV